MFCVKCGTECSASDMYCSKCGAKNENYSEPKGKKEKPYPIKVQKNQQAVSKEEEPSKQSKSKKSKMVVPILMIVVVICVAAGIFYGYMKKNRSTEPAFEPEGLSAIIDNEERANFIVDGQVVTFKGEYVDGKSTPDHNKFVLLNYDGTLMSFASQDSDPQLVAFNVGKIIKVTDNGCMYVAGKEPKSEDIIKALSDNPKNYKSLKILQKEFSDTYENTVSNARKFYKEKLGEIYINDKEEQRLNVYYFDSSKIVNLDVEDSDDFIFADNSLTFAYKDPKGRLQLYIEDADSIKVVYEPEHNIDICGLTSDGENLIWSEEKNGEVSVYNIKNNIPERIGTLNCDSFNYVFTGVTFFEEGFLITCPNSDTVLLSQNDKVKVIPLDGIKNLEFLTDDKGNNILDFVSDTKSIYFTTIKEENIRALFRLDSKGTVKEIAPELNWYNIIGSKILYFTGNNDLYIAKMNKNGISKSFCVTTEVEGCTLSRDKKTVYIEKSGELYYWDIDDKKYQLNKIADNFSNGSICMADKDTILYMKDLEEVEDSDEKIGTLYYYEKGGSEPQEIGKNVVRVMSNDTSNILPENISIIQYSKKDDEGNLLYNICMLDNKKLKTVIKDVTVY